jgi:hypothetical protein
VQDWGIVKVYSLLNGLTISLINYLSFHPHNCVLIEISGHKCGAGKESWRNFRKKSIIINVLCQVEFQNQRDGLAVHTGEIANIFVRNLEMKKLLGDRGVSGS